MAFTITTKVSGLIITVEGDDAADAMEQCGFVADLPSECPICGSPYSFFHRKTPNTGDDYYGVRCRPTDPDQLAHESNFGQYKDKNMGFFYKGEWKDIFVPDGSRSSGGGGGRDDRRRDDRRDDRRRDDRRDDRRGRDDRRDAPRDDRRREAPRDDRRREEPPRDDRRRAPEPAGEYTADPNAHEDDDIPF